MKITFYLATLLIFISSYGQKNKRQLYDTHKVFIQLNEMPADLVSSSDNFLLFQGGNYFSIWSAKDQRKLYEFSIDGSEIKALLTPNSENIIFFLKKNDTEAIFTGKLEVKSGLYEEKKIRNKEFNPLNFKAKFKISNQNKELYVFSNNSLWSFHLEDLTVEKSLSLQKNLEDSYIDFLFIDKNHICFKIESDIKKRYFVSQLRPSEWKLDSIMLLHKTSKKLSKIKLQENAIGAYSHAENKIIVDYNTKISVLNVFNLAQQEYPKKENERVYKTFIEKNNTLLILGDKNLARAQEKKSDSLYKAFEKSKEKNYDVYTYTRKISSYNLLHIDKIDTNLKYVQGKIKLPFGFDWDPCPNYFISNAEVVYKRSNGVFSYYSKLDASQRWNIDYTRESLSIREGLTLSDAGDFTFFGSDGLTVLNVAKENDLQGLETDLILKNKFFLRNQNALSVYIKKEKNKNLILVDIRNDKGVLLWQSELINSKIKKDILVNTYLNQEQTKAFISISPLYYNENNKEYSYVLDLDKRLITKYKYKNGVLISKDFSFISSFFNDYFLIYSNNSKNEQKIENTVFLTALNNNNILYKKNDSDDFIVSGTVSEKGIKKKIKYNFQTTKNFNPKYAPFHYQNDKKLIFGANKNQLFIWNLNEKNPFKKITLSYDNPVYLVSSNKQLFIYHDNGFIDILDLETFTIVSTFTIHTKNENSYKAFFNKDLQFFIPKEIIREYHFVKDFETYPLLSYELFLNRPDIILSSLGYTAPSTLEIYKKAYLKRLKNAGFSEQTDYLSIVKPTISLKNRGGISSIATTKNLQLDLETSADVDSTFIYINGVPIIKDKIQKNAFSTSVVLGNGLNKITIIASNKEGIRSEPISLETTLNNPEKPKIYYIGVGVSSYLDNSMNLKFADKDVRSISKTLSKKFDGRIQIDTLTNANATKENILKLKSILNKTTINDVVIISFSGHGLVNETNDFFFATHNIDFKNPAINGLSYADIQNLTQDIPARKKLLLIDACHSGELDNEELSTTEKTSENVTSYIPEGAKGAIGVRSKSGFKTSFEVMKSLFYDSDRGNGSFVISAAGGKEFAFESKDWGNGVFTYSFLKALEDLTLDKFNYKQAVTISMIKDYIYKNVIKLTNNQQKPTSRSDNIEWDWVLIE